MQVRKQNKNVYLYFSTLHTFKITNKDYKNKHGTIQKTILYLQLKHLKMKNRRIQKPD